MSGQFGTLAMFYSTWNCKGIDARIFVIVFGEVVAAGPHFTLGGFPCLMLVSGHHHHNDDSEEINNFVFVTMMSRTEIIKFRLTR